MSPVIPNPTTARKGGRRERIADAKVAIIRAAVHEGLVHKVIAARTGVSVRFVDAVAGGIRPHILPCPKFSEAFRSAFMVKMPHDGGAVEG